MELQELTNLILNTGVTIVVIAYFIYRDFKFMQKLDSTLATLKDVIDKIGG